MNYMPNNSITYRIYTAGFLLICKTQDEWFPNIKQILNHGLNLTLTSRIQIMHMMFTRISLAIAFALLFFVAVAQTSLYNPQQVFAQDLYTKNGNELRSSNGAPG